MPSGDEHYPADVVGAARGMPGAGILAWLTGDQLHPPMLADETMWSDGRQWQDGARRYVIELGRAAGLRPGDRVLDLGCGVCGPARTLVDTFDVTVDAVTTSQAHAETSRAINALSSVYSDRINVVWVAGAANWPDRVYDTVWSLNMMYQVPDHQEVYGRIFDQSYQRSPNGSRLRCRGRRYSRTPPGAKANISFDHHQKTPGLKRDRRSFELNHRCRRDVDSRNNKMVHRWWQVRTFRR